MVPLVLPLMCWNNLKIRYLIAIILFILTLQSMAGGSNNKELILYVSKDGNDSFSGTLPYVNKDKTDGPFATIEKARDNIRELKKKRKLAGQGVSIFIREGVYFVTKTIEFTNKDSGAESSPIVYRAYKNERVKLIGGEEISGFKPIADQAILERIYKPYQDKILQVDLKAMGITDFGELMPRGFTRPMYPSGLELFFQDKPMQLARWPNSGWSTIAGVPAGQQGGKFSYDGDRPKRWSNSNDIWVHGYWTWNWADSYVKVKSIDIEKREFVTKAPHGVYGYSVGKRYYALNILEELDEPGEWYLDRKTGILYFWPPSAIIEGKAYVSLLDTVIQLNDVSYVTLQGLEIGICRGTAIKIIGGDHNKIARCLLRNIGNIAVTIEGGKENGISGCDIYGCGGGGIVLGGGDRRTLIAANNYACNNHIYDYNRWDRTYRPAIAIEGVGNKISNNLIHDAPHSAIILHGNEHIIEFNEIHHVCIESDDVGAFYVGRDYSERGNIVRYNFFHDLNTGTGNVQAVYLDDFNSGTNVFGNVIYAVATGVLIGGGRDNNIQNNIFINCRVTAIHIDARGLTGEKKYFDGRYPILLEKLNEVKYKELPYSTRYPKLLTLYDDDPATPKGNSITNNIVYGEKWLDLLNGVDDRIVAIRNNYAATKKDFIDLNKLNFQLKDDSPAYKNGFQRIPIEKIGLYDDGIRTSRPVSEINR